MLYYKKLPLPKRVLLKIIAIAKNPFVAISTIIAKAPFKFVLKDAIFLKIRYKGYTGMRLNLKNPKRFNEKMQWLKLNNRNDAFTALADKYEVRKLISQQIGEQYLVPLIRIFNRPEEIKLEELPDQFVLKCTHDSGSTIICDDKNRFDIIAAKKYLSNRLKRNYFFEHREYQYKNIPPRIVCEELISTDTNTVPEDYKIFCFSGNPQYIQVDLSRFEKHERIIYDANWKKQPFNIKYALNSLDVKKPSGLSEMLTLASKLAKAIPTPFLRVDFYQSGEKIYFGELTFFEEGGYGLFYPDQYDFELGKLINLNQLGNNQ